MPRLFATCLLFIVGLFAGGASAVQLQPDHAPGMCLDFLGGDGQIRPCKNTSSQDFTLPSREIPQGTPLRVGGGCVEARGEGQRLKGVQCRDVDAQRWIYFRPVGLFKNPSSGLCIDVQGAGKAIRTPVIAYRCGNSANQYWKQPKLVVAALPQTLRPIYATNMCLDLNESKGELILWSCHGGANQRFTMPNGPQADEIKMGRKCMSTLNEGRLILIEEKRCGYGPYNGLWIADGTGTIRNSKYRTCLTVDGQSTNRGAKLSLRQCVNGAPNQIFRRM